MGEASMSERGLDEQLLGYANPYPETCDNPNSVLLGTVTDVQREQATSLGSPVAPPSDPKLREAAVIRLEVLSPARSRFIVLSTLLCAIATLIGDSFAAFVSWDTSGMTYGPYYPDIYNWDNRTMLFNLSVPLTHSPAVLSYLKLENTQQRANVSKPVSYSINQVVYSESDPSTPPYGTSGNYYVDEVFRFPIYDETWSLISQPLLVPVELFRGAGHLDDHNIYKQPTMDNRQVLRLSLFVTIHDDGFSFLPDDDVRRRHNVSDERANSIPANAFDEVAFRMSVSNTLLVKVEVLYRYLLIFVCLVLHQRFNFACRDSIDNLRAEHRLLRWGYFFLVLYLGPFAFLMLLPIPEGAAQLSCFLLIQLPLVGQFYLKAALWAIVSDISSSSKDYRLKRVQQQQAPDDSTSGAQEAVYTRDYMSCLHRTLLRLGGSNFVASLRARPWFEKFVIARETAHVRCVCTWMSIFITLQVAYLAASEDVTSQASDVSIFVATYRLGGYTRREYTLWVIGLFNLIANLILGLNVLAGILGGLCWCCRCCSGMHGNLRSMVFFATRDRQLLIRLITFLILTFFVWYAIDLILSPPSVFGVSTGQITMMMWSIVQLCTNMQPVFLESNSTIGAAVVPTVPPTPSTEEWMRTRWSDEGAPAPIRIPYDSREEQQFCAMLSPLGAWMHKTPGAMTLYPLPTLEEEQAFLEKNNGSGNALHLLNFYNHEKVAAALHFSGEAYRLEWMSAASASVAASLLCLCATAVDCEPEMPPQGESDTSENSPSRIAALANRFRPQINRAPKNLALIEEHGTNFVLLHVQQAASMQVAYFRWKNRLVVSFRGSHNLDNWKADLRMLRVVWVEMQDVAPKNLVHSGFAKLWGKISHMVHECVCSLRLPDDMVYVVGHSLGGAMATLCAFSLARRFQHHVSIEVCTFGCPLVGNAKFRRIYNKFVPKTYRVVNRSDLVTRTKFTTGNSHMGTLVLVAAETGMVSVKPTWFEKFWRPTDWCVGSAKSHAVQSYKNALAASYAPYRSPLRDLVMPPWAVSFLPTNTSASCCC
eukprot:Rhum_TRINITY_DN15590_c0_g1::Rhum_TRINITY_DN15590_c0_g1_i1::g.161399::m.161399